MGLLRKEDMHESFWKEGVSNPNLLINGDFQVWQRGTSFGDIYNKYSADRWYVSKTSGTHSFEKIDKGMKVITNGTTYVQQYIENSSKLKNTLLTFTVSIDDVKYSITGKPIDGVFLDTTNVIIKIDYDESKNLVVVIIRINSTTSTINWAKLEMGSLQTPFTPRPYGEELALCQRYYQVLSGDVLGNGYMNSQGSGAYIMSPLIAPMRAIPHVSYSGSIEIRISSDQIITVTTNKLSVYNSSNNSITFSIPFDSEVSNANDIKLRPVSSFISLANEKQPLILDSEIY